MKPFYQVLFIAALLMQSSAYSQQKEEAPDGWTPSSEVALNLSQIAFTNWSQGGQNSITWAFLTANTLGYKYGTWVKHTNLKISYGRTKISGQESRVNDNEFFLETVVSKNIGWIVDPYFSNNIRTPIGPGFDYSISPDTQVVTFFDPGYVTQSIGFTYGYIPGLKVRAGFAVQEIFTNKFRKYTDDITTPEAEAFKLETGIETVAEGDFNLTETVNYKSNLRLFTRFEMMDVWDVRWDNIITAKITDFINVNFNVLLLQDIKQTRRTQVKEALQIGIFFKLI